MLRVSLLHARPDMVLAMPVHHPRHPEVVLLKAGATLDEHSIPRMKELHVQDVWIQYPGLEDLVRFVDPRVLSSYRELTTTVGVALDTAMVQSHVEMDFYNYKRAVMSVLDRLMDNPNAAMFVTELVGGDRPFVRHAGNVCVLSILMGLKLEFYLVRERAKLSSSAARDISGLGVGAMFHDLGMSRLDAETLARWNETQDESDPKWQEHVQIGFDLVKAQVDPAAAAVVLHHHQKYDGSGFPKRATHMGKMLPVQGSDIYVFARIVACADLYDRLHHPANSPGATALATPSIPAVRALKMMAQQPYRRWVDPIVFLSLLAVTPPYPPGSMVTLSDGRTAAIVDWSPLDPCRPTVEIINPLKPELCKHERIDLRKNPDLQVASIDGEDVLEDNFYPTYEGEFDLTRIGKAMSIGMAPMPSPTPVVPMPAAAPPKPAAKPKAPTPKYRPSAPSRTAVANTRKRKAV
jgi:HD-GYP domain-containing protein (c-di-GMP phosphodiesterase class II)